MGRVYDFKGSGSYESSVNNAWMFRKHLPANGFELTLCD